MAERLYINNFRGRSGRTEHAKQLVDEFLAIEDAFSRLQALNINNYLTIYVNETALSGTITIIPDNGYLQELTLTEDTAIAIAPPTTEARYRISLLIHGGGFKVTNLWGAQTWKEYGIGVWWDLYTAEGPFASMLLDFWWDICSHTWICVASSKNQFHLITGGTTEALYPLLFNLFDSVGLNPLVLARASHGMVRDHNQAYHYHIDDEARFAGARYIDNWCATPSDLTSVAWVPTDVTVTTDAGVGPVGEAVQRLSFDVTGGKLATFILPSFGRSYEGADSIKVAVTFQGRTTGGLDSVRVYASFMGKTALTPPVHDVVQVNMDTSWQQYGVILDVTKDGNADTSLALNQESPKTLIEIAFASPSGSAGSDVQITDVQIEVLRGTDDELVSPETQDGTIGASMVLTATGTGGWDDGTKVMTMTLQGQDVDFGANLSIGRAYLVHLRLTAGDAVDIRMQNETAFWVAGSPSDDTYLQDAPFVFKYDGGILKFILTAGSTATYLVDIYEMSGNHGVSGFENLVVVGDNGELFEAIADPPIPLNSGIPDGVIREIASTNNVAFNFFRTFTDWDQLLLTGVAFNSCKTPVLQTEYGIDGWPTRATLIQDASTFSNGYIERAFTIPVDSNAHDFKLSVRHSVRLDKIEGIPEGPLPNEFGLVVVELMNPQGDGNEITVPPSRYIDFEVELTGGVTPVTAGRIRLDIATGDISSTDDGLLGKPFNLDVYFQTDWIHTLITIKNNGGNDTLNVRVYPASSFSPEGDPSVVDVEATGWVIIDWAQLEDSVGNLYATEPVNSPIVGGETRAIEDFTAALADGEFYRLEGMGHVASLVTNAIIWDIDEDVYKNLLYTTDAINADIVARNMHEFGLVADAAPPVLELTLITTTLYPVEVFEKMQFGVSLIAGSMSKVPEEAMDMAVTPKDGNLTAILLTGPTEDDAMDMAVTPKDGSLTLILLTAPTEDDAMDVAVAPQDGNLREALVPALMPDEGTRLGCSLIGGSMTHV